MKKRILPATAILGLIGVALFGAVALGAFDRGDDGTGSSVGQLRCNTDSPDCNDPNSVPEVSAGGPNTQTCMQGVDCNDADLGGGSVESPGGPGIKMCTADHPDCNDMTLGNSDEGSN